MAVDKAMPAAYPVLRNARLKGDSSASGPIPLVLSAHLSPIVNDKMAAGVKYAVQAPS